MSWEESCEALSALRRFRELGGDVLVLDYGGEKIEVFLEVLQHCAAEGFKCYAASRALNHLPGPLLFTYSTSPALTPAGYWLKLTHLHRIL